MVLIAVKKSPSHIREKPSKLPLQIGWATTVLEPLKNFPDVHATFVFQCTGCDPNHIDMSPGLLREIVGPGIDQVTDGVWWFGGAPAPEKPKPKPTTSSTPPPPPSTTSKARPSTTSTRASSTTSSAAKTSSTASSTSTSAPASPTLGYVDDGKVHNLEDFNVLLINLGGLVASAVNANA